MREQRWIDYDPAWLVALALKQEPDVVAALQKCKRAFVESKAYVYFVLPVSPNKPGSEWQFDRNVRLVDSKHGEILLDVLRDGRVGGIEFLVRL